MQPSQASTFQSQHCTGQSCSPLTTSPGTRHGLGLSGNHTGDFLAAELRAGKDVVSSPEHTGMGLRDPGDNGSDSNQHLWCINVPGKDSMSLEGRTTIIPHRSQEKVSISVEY